MELYMLVETVCSAYGSCSDWIMDYGLTLEDCRWAMSTYYGDGIVSCIFERYGE